MRRRLLLLPLVASLGLASVAPAAPPEAALEIDALLYLGPALQLENVSLWPVYSREPSDPLGAALVPLPEAQEQGWAVVRERGGQGDAVDELVLENRGERPILVLAGTLVKGGRQDRQIGQDFIVPARKTVPVAAFCVEHGRWTAEREGQATGGLFKAQKALATKAVRSSGQYKGDQGEVWSQVAKENARAGKAPASGTLLAALEDADEASQRRRARILAAATERLAALAGEPRAPLGLAYAVDGKVREVRVFNHPALFQRVAETLLRTVALEADLAQREAQAAGRAIHTAPADPRQVAALVQRVARLQAEESHNKAGNVVRERKDGAVWNTDCASQDDPARPATRSFMFAE
ncbi:MAG TPA: hypothetical protein PK668_06565 [Myxococcota bacterium]|nr:hypothetical protein [Myxococcota bacterium]HRY92494.1 hypothetical protein [Myxococcota bacterium]